mgnify:CR=1 FL=1
MATKIIANDPIIDSATDEKLNTPAKGYAQQLLPGLQIVNSGDLVPLTPALAARDFCKLVIGVAKNATWNYHSDLKTTDRIIRAARKAHRQPEGPDAHFKIDDGDWDWLTKKIEEHGALVFGVNTAAVREALDKVIAPEKKEAAA